MGPTRRWRWSTPHWPRTWRNPCTLPRACRPHRAWCWATSLGGALALKVAEAHADSVQTLVLSVPALYPEAAWRAPHFGAHFRAALSTPFGFMDSSSLDFLRRFRGRTVLIQGEWDGLPATAHGAPAGRSAGETHITLADGRQRTVYSPIPAEVFAALRDAAGLRLQHVQVEGCDHRVLPHLAAHPAVARSLVGLLRAALQPLPADTPAQHLRLATDGRLHPVTA